MLDHHRVFGRAVLPGLAYIDLLFQLARDGLGLDPLAHALRRLAIHAPMAIDDDEDCRLSFSFAPQGDGWHVEVVRVDGAPERLATAELRPRAPGTIDRIDPALLIARADRRIDMARMYHAASARGLVHTGPMRAEGEIFAIGEDRLVRLDATGPALPVLFHPALIDGAGMSTESLRGEDDPTLYLPLFYEAFRSFRPMGRHCYAWIRRDAIRSVNDIHTLDIGFHDEDGAPLAALEGITSKRVRDPKHITEAHHATSTVVQAAAKMPTPSAARPAAARDTRDIGRVLRGIVATRLGVPEGRVDPAAGFFQLGLQSSQLLSVVDDIERAFEIGLSPTLLFEHGTLDEVTRHVADLLGETATAVTAESVAIETDDAGPAPVLAEYFIDASDRLLDDHRIQGQLALMGIVHPCLALDSAARVQGGGAVALRRVVFHGGPIMPEPDERIRLAVEWPADAGREAFRVVRRPDGDLHCTGHRAADPGPRPAPVDPDALWAEGTPLDDADLQRIYEGVPDFRLGDTLRTIERAVRVGRDRLVSRIDLRGKTGTAPDGRPYAIDPILLASCYFIDGGSEGASEGIGDGTLLVPLAIERITLYAPVPERALIVNTVHVRRDDFTAFDAEVYDERGHCVAAIRNASMSMVRDPARLGITSDPAPAPEPMRQAGGERIAVVGLSGRYPMARDLDEFWRNLRTGRDCVSEIPAERWDWRDHYSPDPRQPGRIQSKWGGFLDDIDQFAPLFFSISPREAAFMDPQERLFLEESWNALEDAGYTRAGFAGGQAGVFVAVMTQEYALYAVDPAVGAGRIGVPSGVGSIANRVSFCLDFRGPSVTIDTMCSGSLTAIALACDALAAGRIDGALAGGVNLSVHPNKYLMLGQGGFLSSQGKCGSFGTGSGGYVPGEGVGVAVLKRLDDAVRDGDRVLGVIRGVAINHGGRSSGYAVPNPKSQYEVIRRAWKQAGIDPRLINCIEAHGTGTLLGDPIEIEGLNRAFREHTDATGFCAIGSVKSNIGHCESAAGIAALTKVLLQLRHGERVPSLHCETPNPNIDFSRSPFVLQRDVDAWPRPALHHDDGRRIEFPRLAGISSFGAGGSNAHMVVEEHLPVPRPALPRGRMLVVLSAKLPEELDARIERLLAAIRDDAFTEDDLPSIAWTLQTGREAMDERFAVVAGNLQELAAGLADQGDGVTRPGLYRARVGADTALSLFSRDDFADTLAQWATAGKLAEIAELWVRGVNVDWRTLHPHGIPRRIGMPTYPFVRERCWLAPAPAPVERNAALPASATAVVRAAMPAASVAAADLPATGTPAADAVGHFVFAEHWRHGRIVPAARDPDDVRPLTCLVFASTPALRAAIAGAMAEVHGAVPREVRLVFVADTVAADAGATDDADDIALDAGDPRALADTFAQLRERLPHIDVALYAWTLERPQAVADPAALMHALQALSNSGIALDRFLVAGQAPADTLEACHLETQDAILRSAAQALPLTRFASVFAEQPGPPEPVEWAHRLAAEARADRIEAARYRNGLRLVRDIRRTTLPEAGGMPPFREGGAYLVIGGLGGLGFALSQWLLRTLGARVLVLGRSPLDDARRGRLAALAAAGGAVDYRACDVADAAALAAVLAEMRARFGPLHGVFHAGGIAGRTALADKTLEEFREVLAPKVAGTLALDEALARVAAQAPGDAPLDFVCYFSSLAAVLGDFGSCDYAAGNRFQAAYAAWRNRQGLPGRTVAINWPLWRESGLEFGTADSRELYLKISGQRPLSSEDALALLPSLLALGEPSPILLVGEYERLRATLNPKPLRAVRTAVVAHAEGASAVADPELPLHIERDLRDVVGALLHIAPERVHRGINLADFGFDSVSLQEFAVRLSDRYGIDVAAATFYDYPSIQRLAVHLAGRHGDVIALALGHAAAPNAAAEPVAPSSAAVPATASMAAGEPLSAAISRSNAIAVIGMSGRFPQARDIDGLWRILAEGRDAIEEIPIERFDWRPLFVPGATVVPGRTNGKWSGLVPGVGEFDPLFFEISPREAAQIDPRQRLLLQEAYRALEDAAIGPIQLAAASVGVFVGAEAGAYGGLESEKETITANHEAILAARLSYFLDLTGPNLAINTACSSGLVALHQACLHLRAGECDVAVAAAVNLLLAPESFVGMSQTGMLSPDGRCFAFDRRANGIVPGEAVVALVLKRLAAAERDGDPIHAVIRGSGVNYDGRTNGLTAPSGRAQQQLLGAVYDSCGVDPADIGQVVAHGTATSLGDQIEVRALREAFAARTDRRRYCALTSTKANLGHTFAPSGLVSLVALILSMRHGVIPGNPQFVEANAHMHWEDSPFLIGADARPWPETPGKPRLGAVSAFGMSGTNAHVVAEVYADARPAPAPRPTHLWTLSGRDDEALRRRAAELAAWLVGDAGREAEPGAVAHTLLAGRHHHRHRLAFVAPTCAAAAAVLAGFLAGNAVDGVQIGEVPRDFVADVAATARIARGSRQAADAMETAALVDALSRLAVSYCEGHDLDAAALRHGPAPVRLHLPGYPFERRHYWVARAARLPVDVAPPGEAFADAAPTSDAGSAESTAVRVEAMIRDALGVSKNELGDDDPLDEVGLDSIGAARLLGRIREVLPDAVGSLFLECNTLAAVRAYVDGYRGVVASAAPPVAPAHAADADGEGIAVVGMAGLFPQAEDIDAFWAHLRAGRTVTGPMPSRRRTLVGLPEGGEPAVCHGGFIDAVDTFDHVRFKMSHEEARAADPQLRKLIETVWRAVADSGRTMTDFRKRSTGVFVACAGHSGYREIPGYVSPGTTLAPGETGSLYANRISNLFDLKGPSTVVDAGCASFLVALADAMDALARGRCEQAVVATAQLYLSPHTLASADPGPLYSRGCITRSFARDSDGYVRSEAVGAVILRPMATAQAERDPVRCRLLGAGARHGGKSPLKWYSPNIGGQRAAIREALQHAGVDGTSVVYVETEANGSQLGDASEIVAIQSEYGARPEGDAGATWFGSLKPLCGHAEAASTFPALVKVAMSLRGDEMLGVTDPGERNEGIRFSPGYDLLVGTRHWPVDRPRRAALHSLSVGGTNAHLVLEAAALPPTTVAPVQPRLFVFSAPSVELLRATAAAHLHALETPDRAGLDPADVAFTLRVGREAEACRLAVVADTLPALVARLRGWCADCAGEAAVLAADGSPEALLAQAHAWIAGGRLDTGFADDAARRRVSLPATALRTDAHWHAGIAVPVAVAERKAMSPDSVGAVLLQPKWTRRVLGSLPEAAPPPAVRRVVFCDWTAAQVEAMRDAAGEGGADFQALPLEAASLSERFAAYSKAVFAVVRDMLARPEAGRRLLQVVVPGGLDHVGLHGLVGLMRTAAREHSRFDGQLVVLDRDMDAGRCVQGLRRVAAAPGHDYVQLRGDAVWTQGWERLPADAMATANTRRAEPAVVLITGGTGGIGLDLAEHLLRSDERTTVVLAGRSVIPRQSERIARMQARDDRLHYIAADVGSRGDVEALVAEILRRCGRLTGIFHCAGVTRDAHIVRKDADDIDAVLLPKVAGLQHLDEATRRIPLDFLVAFSSLSAMSGNAGQADYSMANGFMDAFAAYRNQLVCLGERSGRTLSVNWPLWRDGGMRMAEHARQDVADRHGLLPMPNPVGIELAVRLVAGPAAQIAVKYGNVAQLLKDDVECT